MTSSEFKVNLFKYMGLDYDTGTMDFNGNIYANTIVAQQFIGNITAGFPSTANIDIVGNVVGNTVVTDSVTSNFYFGNGSSLTGVTKPFTTINNDILGNVTGSYANVQTIVSTFGNIGSVLLENGNVTVPGALRANNLAISNITGNYANVGILVATIANIANVLFENGNVIIPGNLTAGLISGNIVANNVNISNLVATIANIANVHFEHGNVIAPGNITASLISGNITASYANISNLVATMANIANVHFENGNVTTSGNITAGLISGNIAASYANISNLVATVANIANVHFENGNVTTSGNITAGLFAGNIAANYANVSNLVATVANIANVRFENGNVTVPGNITASLISGNIVANYANIANVRFENGNVTVPGNVTASLISGNIVANYANVSNLVATVANVANVLFENGNVVAPGNVSATFISGNTVISTYANIANVTFLGGNVTTNGNVTAGTLIGNIIAPFGNISNVIFNNGNVFTTGNITAGYFIGNGSLLTDVPGSNIQGTVQRIDISGNVIGTYANVQNFIAVSGNIANVLFQNENVTTTGNVTAGLFIGNGSLLTNVPLPNLAGTTQTIDVIGNIRGQTAIFSNIVANNAFVTGNIDAGYFNGNGYYVTLNGITLIPSGNVANAQVRLALQGVPKGTYVTEQDTELNYLLTAEPPNVSTNWLLFEGTNNVPSVFGRVGAIVANVGDYTDSFITLSQNVGPIFQTINTVANALQYLYTSKANVVNGNVTANFFLGDVIAPASVTATNFIGNGAGLTNIPITELRYTVQDIGITGNVIGAYANVANIIAASGNVANVLFANGNISTTGNVSAGLFVGNGAGLTNVPGNIQYTVQPVSILGNVIGSYANVANVIAASGNVANVLFANGNISTTGNISAGIFVGNGAGLTNVPFSIALTGQVIDISGNVIGTYANVNNVIANAGNIGNIIFQSGNIVTTGNIAGGFFSGNGAGLTNLQVNIALTRQTIDVSGNIIGNYANVTNIIAVNGNVGNVIMAGGNIMIPGSLSVGTIFGNLVGNFANVTNVFAAYGNVGNVIMTGGNITIPGALSVGALNSNLIGNFANVTNVIAVYGNVGNVIMTGGNITAPGTLTAGTVIGNLIGNFANVANIVAASGNIGNVLITGGNVTAVTFIGSGALLTNIAVPTSAVVTSTTDVLTATSTRARTYTGGLTTVTLPDATTLPLGATFLLTSAQSSTAGNYTVVQTNAAASTVYSICAGGSCKFTLISNGTSTGSWVTSPFGEANAGCMYVNTFSPISNNGRIFFKTIVNDNLNQYNTSTGVFTARNTGTYTVTGVVSLLNSTTVTGYGIILVAGGVTYYLYYQQLPSGNGNYYMMQGTISVFLTAGQTIFLNLSTGSGATNVVTDTNEPTNRWTYLTITKS